METRPTPRRSSLQFARLLALAAGSLDFCTGLALAIAPATTLRLMLITEPISAEAQIYLRFVGAFVAAVGSTYLYALARGELARLRAAFEFTLIFRLAAGLFTAIALIQGWLPLPWISVPITDFTLVVLQLHLLRHTLRDAN